MLCMLLGTEGVESFHILSQACRRCLAPSAWHPANPSRPPAGVVPLQGLDKSLCFRALLGSGGCVLP